MVSHSRQGMSSLQVSTSSSSSMGLPSVEEGQAKLAVAAAATPASRRTQVRFLDLDPPAPQETEQPPQGDQASQVPQTPRCTVSSWKARTVPPAVSSSSSLPMTPVAEDLWHLPPSLGWKENTWQSGALEQDARHSNLLLVWFK